MVLDETDCIVEAARRLLEFYAHESCGKCTPCREGTWWAERVLGRIEDGYGRAEDMPLLSEVGGNILFRAFCALADGAVSPISSTLQYFRTSTRRTSELRPVPAEHGAAGPGRGRGGGLVSAPMVTLTIDGKEVTVPAGTLIIRAAEQLGIEIPRFCDHPLLEPVGACRQCYVEVEGQRKLFTSCTTTVAPGHGGHDAEHQPAGGGRAGREPRVPAAQPPARLPDLRPRRRVPAAGPGAGVRAGREPLHRGEADVSEAAARCRRS